MPIFCVQDNQHSLGLVIEQTKREENMKRKDQVNFTTYYDKKEKKKTWHLVSKLETKAQQAMGAQLCS